MADETTSTKAPKTKSIGPLPIANARGIPGWKEYQESANKLSKAREASETEKDKIREKLTQSRLIQDFIRKENLDTKAGYVDFTMDQSKTKINIVWVYKPKKNRIDLSAEFEAVLEIYSGLSEKESREWDKLVLVENKSQKDTDRILTLWNKSADLQASYLNDGTTL